MSNGFITNGVPLGWLDKAGEKGRETPAHRREMAMHLLTGESDEPLADKFRQLRSDDFRQRGLEKAATFQRVRRSRLEKVTGRRPGVSIDRRACDGRRGSLVLANHPGRINEVVVPEGSGQAQRYRFRFVIKVRIIRIRRDGKLIALLFAGGESRIIEKTGVYQRLPISIDAA